VKDHYLLCFSPVQAIQVQPWNLLDCANPTMVASPFLRTCFDLSIVSFLWRRNTWFHGKRHCIVDLAAAARALPSTAPPRHWREQRVDVLACGPTLPQLVFSYSASSHCVFPFQHEGATYNYLVQYALPLVLSVLWLICLCWSNTHVLLYSSTIC
jgi:hypothetical protein